MTIDLKDAYYQIPIWPGHWRFLRFAFEGRIFEFQVLPFGPSLAPSDLYQLHVRSPRTLEAAGAQYTELFGRLADLRNSEELCRQHVALL